MVTGVVTEADVRTAQTVLDAWFEEVPPVDTVDPRDDWRKTVLTLRGLIAATLADVRTAGYLEGVQTGRREAAHVVLDALRGEGLAP